MPVVWVRHPFLVPYWRRGELVAAVVALARNDARTADAFARRFRDRVGVQGGVAIGSARAGLELALRERGVGPGDEVVLPTFACAALLSAIRRVGATGVFADVDVDLTLTPEAAAAACSPRTKALVAVHDGGLRADVAGIRRAVGSGVALIEDAAQATGAHWPLAGDYVIWSFGLGKNLIATRGGFVLGLRDGPGRSRTSGRRATARRLWDLLVTYSFARYTRPFVVALRKYASSPSEDRLVEYEPEPLSPLDAAILVREIASLDEILAARRRNALALIEELADEPRVHLPPSTDHVFTKFHLTLRDATRPAPGGRAPELAALTRALLRAGFEPESAYTPLHLRFGGAAVASCPVAEDRYWRTFTLPVRPGIPTAEIRRMAGVIRDHLRR